MTTCCSFRHCRGRHQRQQHLQPRGMQQVWDQALNLATQPEHSGYQLLRYSDCCERHHNPEQLTGHEVPGHVRLDGVMPRKPAEHSSCRTEQSLQQAAQSEEPNGRSILTHWTVPSSNVHMSRHPGACCTGRLHNGSLGSSNNTGCDMCRGGGGKEKVAWATKPQRGRSCQEPHLMSKVAHLKCCNSSCTLTGSCTLI